MLRICLPSSTDLKLSSRFTYHRLRQHRNFFLGSIFFREHFDGEHFSGEHFLKSILWGAFGGEHLDLHCLWMPHFQLCCCWSIRLKKYNYEKVRLNQSQPKLVPPKLVPTKQSHQNQSQQKQSYLNQSQQTFYVGTNLDGTILLGLIQAGLFLLGLIQVGLTQVGTNLGWD